MASSGVSVGTAQVYSSVISQDGGFIIWAHWHKSLSDAEELYSRFLQIIIIDRHQLHMLFGTSW